MKTENNFRNQISFFGLYTENRIYSTSFSGYCDITDWLVNCYPGYMELKPLSSMTDENALLRDQLSNIVAKQ